MDERKRSLRKEIVRLALPIALQQFMTALVGACDAIMLGKLSQDAMSAVSLATQVTFVFNLFMFAFMAGENMFVAQYYGKGDYTGISQVFSLVTKICGCIAVVFLAGALFFPEQLMRILTNEETLIVLGSEYLRVIGISYVFSGIAQTFLAIMKNCGAVNMSTLINGVMVILNIVLNAVFIFGLSGFPKMGIKGAAIGTLTARSLEFLIVLFYVAKIDKKAIKKRLCAHHMCIASLHSFSLNPVSTKSSPITRGRFTSIPSVARSFSCSSSDISFNLSFNPISL